MSIAVKVVGDGYLSFFWLLAFWPVLRAQDPRQVAPCCVAWPTALLGKENCRNSKERSKDMGPSASVQYNTITPWLHHADTINANNLRITDHH